MEDCIFCKIVSGKIPCNKIWEDKDFFAFLDINPVNPGHTLVIPKRHAEYLFELDEPLYSGLMRAVRDLSHAIKSSMGPKRIGVIVEGFAIPHVHVHLIPINRGGELSLGNGKRAGGEELADAAKRILAEMKPRSPR
jgi:histidine triad (HIT) family protein